MRIAAIYDIHGNLPALEAVLGEVVQAKVDLLVVGGDVVAGPLPRETLTALLNLEIPVRFVRGNADRCLVEWMAGESMAALPERVQKSVVWVAEQLEAEHLRFMASWPAKITLKVDGIGDVLFCHATPRSDKEVFTRITPQSRLLPLFADVTAKLVVCGHTHMQFDRQIGAVRVVNAGSVGKPYGKSGAYWLMLAPDVQFRRTRYNLQEAAKQIRATTYPQAETFVRDFIIGSLPEAEALEWLESRAFTGC